LPPKYLENIIGLQVIRNVKRGESVQAKLLKGCNFL